MSDSLANWAGKKIVVVGDVMLDVYKVGYANQRPNPECPGAHLVEVVKTEECLGGAANVARNLASLGARVHLFGVGGDDYAGNKVYEICSDKGINCEIQYDGRSTTVKTRVVEATRYQQLLRLDEEEKEPISIDVAKGMAIDINSLLADRIDAIVLPDYRKGMLIKELTQEVIAAYQAAGVPILVDPKPVEPERFYGCDLVSPNLEEAQKVTGRTLNIPNGLEDTPELRKLGESVRNVFSAQNAVITCGKHGMVSVNGMEEFAFAHTKPIEVYDETGAGDTVISVLAMCYAASGRDGFNISEATEIANVAGGLVVQKIGTSVLKVDELTKALAD